MSKPQTSWYRLEPTDAWFFRDGKPSNRDEDQSDLESLFPPHPSTVVGALRAALAREQGWDGQGKWHQKLNHVLGDGFDDLGQLEFVGPLLEKDERLLFPMPAHVLGKTDQDARTFEPRDWLVPSGNPIACDLGVVHLPKPLRMHRTGNGEKAPGPADGFFVTEAGMSKILHGNLPCRDDCVHRDKLFRLEGRVGIERDVETRTTGDGAMYSPRYVRLKPDVRLVVGISGLVDGWTLPPFFPLGGESRLAGCDKIDPPAFPDQPTNMDKTLVVLAAPSRFAGGKWWGAGPGDDAQQLAPAIRGDVLTASLERPLGIGGWDSGSQQSLALRPYVRPGAVWWLDAEASVDANEAEYISIGDRTAYGYGLAFMGKSTSGFPA